MGKKSTWFSAIKRVFTSNSKDKLLNDGDKTSGKEKKSGRGGRSFIPLFREPSSIEKILEEVDQQRLFIAHPPQQQQQQQPQQQQQQQKPQQLKQHEQQQLEQQQQQLEQQQHEQQQQQQHERQQQNQSEQQLDKQQQHEQRQQQQHEQQQKQYQQQQQKQEQPSSSSARPLSPISRSRITSPLPRPAPKVVVDRPIEISHRPQPTQQQQNISATIIQAAYRGHLARRKVKGLTGHVRLQGVIKGQNVKRQTVNAMKQMQLLVRVQTQIQSRRIQTLENQALKRQTNNNDKQVESSLGNNTSETGDEYWDDSFITKEERQARSQKKVEAVIKRERAMAYAYSHKLGKATPTTAAQSSLMDIRTGGYPWWSNWLDRQLPGNNSPQPLTNRQFTSTSSKPTPNHKPTHKQLDTPTTPMSSKSITPSRTGTPPNRIMKYFKPTRGNSSPYSVKDDDSMMSCPAFSVPNYMSPTISAKAKARPTSNPKDRVSVSPSTPGSATSSKRRFSFPFTPNNNRGNRSPRSVGNMSINSAVSVPASLGRKPFNRFV